jgi:hypothetical protein
MDIFERLHHPLNFLGSDRASYLAFVVGEQVATEEEQAEYRVLNRDKVLKAWAEHAAEVEERAAERRERDLKTIEYHRGMVSKFRAIGAYDYAVKREEYVYFLEKRLDDVWAFSGMERFKGFPSGWGDELLREAEKATEAA